MIEALKNKQKRLLSSIHDVPYVREEIVSLESTDRLVALEGSRSYCYHLTTCWASLRYLANVSLQTRKIG
jgi:hypothetical protein